MYFGEKSVVPCRTFPDQLLEKKRGAERVSEEFKDEEVRV
jgi:hypothetical protein